MRNMVGQLETENEKLRQHLALVYDVRPENEIPAAADSVEPLTGRRNLENLYLLGFHICNIHFGQTRTSECLFCAAFLRRERE